MLFPAVCALVVARGRGVRQDASVPYTRFLKASKRGQDKRGFAEVPQYTIIYSNNDNSYTIMAKSWEFMAVL